MKLFFQGILLLVCALAPGFMTLAAPSPIETTIKAIHGTPQGYRGKRVRLDVTFDECVSLTCQVCDGTEAPSEEEEGNLCMGIELTSTQAPMDGVGSDDVAPNEDSVRFTTARIEATYSGACGGMTSDGQVVVCTDRVSELVDAKIVAVLVRRPSTKGRISMYGKNPPMPAPVEDARSIRSAYDSASSIGHRKSTPQDFVYLVGPHPERPDQVDEKRGGLCVCTSGACTSADWPRRLGDVIIATSSNPYRCWEAVRRDDNWQFPIR